MEMEIPMRKTHLFAGVAATLFLATGIGMWAASTQARVAPVLQVESPSILEITLRAGDLPTAHDADYTFVF
jgi:hypothetical protein